LARNKKGTFESHAPQRESPFRRFPQSSSASRFTAGAAGFFTLIQSEHLPGPGRYFEPTRFDTMPSQPSLQAWAKIGFDLVDGS
jgi:hypothetical protein